MEWQTTLKSSFKISGYGLHTGEYCGLAAYPSEAGTGILFQKKGEPELPGFAAGIDGVAETTRNTTFICRRTGWKVMTAEHLLSAFRGMGVDNAVIELDGNEVPILDGSSSIFCNLISQAGTRPLTEPRRIMNLKSAVEISDNGSRLKAVPYDGFKITMFFANDHNHPLLKHQYLEWTFRTRDYVTDIAPARTFGFLKEVRALQEAGLIKGASAETGIVIGHDRILTPLRFDDELVRHKILDLIGDLSVLPPLNAHIIAARSSHRANHLLAQKIRTQFQ